MPNFNQVRIVGPLPSGWIDTLTLAQVDPALGVQSLDVFLTGTIDESVVIESAELAPSFIGVSGTGNFELDRPDGSVVAVASSRDFLGGSLSATDGTVDFAGPSSLTQEASAIGTTTASLPETSFLEGTGSAQLTVRTGSQIVVNAPGNFSAHFKSNATAMIDDSATSIGRQTGGSDTTILLAPSLGTQPVAGATSITQQRTVSDTVTGWTRNLAFNGFDPSLGALVGVEVTVSADSAGTVAAENLGPGSSSLDITQTAAVNVLRVDGTAYATDTVTRHLSDSLTGFDGTEDFGGTSGISGSTALVPAVRPLDIVEYSSAADLAQFFGAGSVIVPVVSKGTTALTASDNLDITSALVAGATVTVRYDYVPGTSSLLSFIASGGTLAVPANPNGTTAAGVQGFTAGDTIDLAGMPFDAGVQGTVGSNGVLTVTSGSASAVLSFDQHIAANQIHVSADAAGTGTAVTLDPSSLLVQGGGQDATSDYVGPVAELQHVYAPITPQTVVATATTDNWFLASGSGTSALQAHGGRNVLDDRGGSAFLVGGTGTDTFFVTAATQGAIWSTIAQAHAGDDITLWGAQPGVTMAWNDAQGAAGYTGLTLTSSAGLGDTTRITLSNYTVADMSNGHISTSFGSVGGNTYFHISLRG